jgi:hypothetical protein
MPSHIEDVLMAAICLLRVAQELPFILLETDIGRDHVKRVSGQVDDFGIRKTPIERFDQWREMGILGQIALVTVIVGV